MIPLLFGPPERRLFGAYHEANSTRSKGTAVVLCNPFGQEAIRTHRLYRVLAGRLSQAGFGVLRFDYFGTGDSSGADEEGDLEGWSRDILSAHREVVRLSGAQHVTWMGSRLGASTAILAAQNAPSNLRRLVFWDPIVDGPAYANLLRVKHVDALHGSFSIPDPSWRARLRSEPTSFSDEAIGLALSPALRTQLSTLVGGRVDLPSSIETIVIADPADEAVKKWISAQQLRSANVRAVAMNEALEWTSDDSLNAALVPNEAVQHLISEIDR